MQELTESAAWSPGGGYGVPVHTRGTPYFAGSRVAIGAFDGVHLGHQALVRQLVLDTRSDGVPAVVYTFDPPPRVALLGAPQVISTAERVRRLASLGVDHIVLARFDATYAARDPQDFLAELGRMTPRALWVGTDFRFGRDRTGDTHLLRRHFELRVMSEVRCAAGLRVSSSRIRSLRAEGRHREARALEGWHDIAAQEGEIHP